MGLTIGPKRHRQSSRQRALALTRTCALLGVIGVAAMCCAQESLEGRHGIRDAGAVHILAPRGLLRVAVSKRDLNIYEGEDGLRVRLVSPDRRVLSEAVFGDDGMTGKGPTGPVETRVLTWQVEHPGLFKLDVDPSSSDVAWGVATSAESYMIESRLLFKRSDIGGSVCFMPPEQPFSMSLGNQGVVVDTTLTDRRGQTIREIQLKPKTPPEAFEMSPSAAHPGPWCLQVSKQMLQATIEGVTTFPDGAGSDYYPARPYWTDSLEAWFDVARVRWLVTPFRRVIYREPGQRATVDFDIHNESDRSERVRLSVENGDSVGATLAPGQTVELEPGETARVTLALRVPDDGLEGGSLQVRVRGTLASEPSVTTYASVDVRTGRAPWRDDLQMPIVLKPYAHESVQFGYEPEYVPNAPYFDLLNRPFIRWRTRHRHWTRAVEVLRDGSWYHGDFRPALKQAFPGYKETWFGTYSHGVKTAFDGANTAYTMLTAVKQDGAREVVLLTSDDSLESYAVHRFEQDPDAVMYEIEQFTGHNRTADPPPILLFSSSGERISRWATPYRLSLYLPRRLPNGQIDVGEPRVITSSCVGVAAHSGGASAMASHGSKVHIAWGETVPADSDAPGVPTYAATFDRETGQLTEKVLLAHGPPVNDVHNSPGIVRDSRGYLHVITGAHGAPFYYVQSHQPDDTSRGWTDPVPVLSAGRKDASTDEDGRGAQTYLGLLCGPDDTLHIAYRQWRANVDPYLNGALYAALSYQRKAPGEPWGPARPLVVPPLPSYSVYYHKLTLDRIGRVFLGYSYYSVNPCYRHDLPGRLDHQALLMSPDGGTTWRLASTDDFIHGVRMAAER